MKKIQKIEAHLQRDFKSNYLIYWNNLSRLTNMLMIVLHPNGNPQDMKSMIGALSAKLK